MSDIRPKSRYLPPEDELSERFIRAGGPGGQHVNRTASAVQLSFAANASDFLEPAVKQRLIRLAGQRADTEGVITIEVRNHRSQYRNRQTARERLADLIERAHHRPRRRIRTSPPAAARRKRLEQKRRRSRTKQLRRGPGTKDL